MIYLESNNQINMVTVLSQLLHSKNVTILTLTIQSIDLDHILFFGG